MRYPAVERGRIARDGIGREGDEGEGERVERRHGTWVGSREPRIPADG